MADLNIGFSAVATGTADVITATYSPAITLADRRIVFLTGCVANTTTTPTFNPNALGAQLVKGRGGSVLKIGALVGDCILIYHTTGTYWEFVTSNLTASTLAQVLANGQSTGGQSIESANAESFALINDSFGLLSNDNGATASNVTVATTGTNTSFLNNGTGFGGFSNIDGVKNEIQHDLLIDLDAPNVNLPQETASLILSTDGTKNIKGLATTTYPSLTELSYVKGVTSAIQIQLNGKEPLKGADDNYVTDAQLVVIANTSGTNSGNETTATLGATINGAASATPNDTDLVVSVESSVVKKNTWTQIKAFLKTYFDTLYVPISTAVKIVHSAVSGQTTVTGVVSNEITYSFLIPANTMIVGDTPEINARFSFINSGAPAGKTVRYYINTSAVIAGANIIATSGMTSAQQTLEMSRRITIKSSTVTEVNPPTVSSNFADNVYSAVPTQYNINWAVNQYIILAIQLGAIADSGVNSYVKLTNK